MNAASRTWTHILTHLAEGGAFASDAARANAIRRAREAALADEGGHAFDQAMADHGAPARPITAQPIRWVPRRTVEERAKAMP